MLLGQELTYKAKLRRRQIKNSQTKLVWVVNVTEIIKAPVLTEKSYKLTDDLNKYTFKVDTRANKNDIAEAIKYMYGVDPVAVNVINVPAQGRFRRKLITKAFKKAIVTLKKGDKIELIK